MSESGDIQSVIAIVKRDKPHSNAMILELEFLLEKAQEREQTEEFHIGRIADLLKHARDFESGTGLAQFLYDKGIRMAPEVNYIPKEVVIKNAADGKVSAPEEEA